MAKCFVIQPFDRDVFDIRYKDTFKPAIEKAGYEAYRVDEDPSVSIPIEQIEKVIREATVCFAEISTDNANVWYELGYAFASRKPVVMVCERNARQKFPFDVQHRRITLYDTRTASDFEALKVQIIARLKAIDQTKIALKEIEKEDPSTDTTESMPQLVARRWWVFALRGLLGLAFGLWALWPWSYSNVFGVFAYYATLDGVSGIVSASKAPGHHWPLLAEGIAGVIAGCLLTFWSAKIFGYFLDRFYLIALWAFVTGTLEIVAGIRLREVIATAVIATAFFPILMGVISLLLGIFITNHFKKDDEQYIELFQQWIGIYALVFGIIVLALAYRLESFRKLEA